MNFELAKHPLVEGLYVVRHNDIDVFFEFASYDAEEQSITFERSADIVTSKLRLDGDQQLRIWETALLNNGCTLEFV